MKGDHRGWGGWWGVVGEGGYRLDSLRAFDLFPMTHHLEVVALVLPPG
jgi:hypothetical protein